MNIYRNLDDNRLYLISHLKRDAKRLNNNGFAGIYASPYDFEGDEIRFLSKDNDKCLLFVENNFKIVSHI